MHCSSSLIYDVVFSNSLLHPLLSCSSQMEKLKKEIKELKKENKSPEDPYSMAKVQAQGRGGGFPNRVETNISDDEGSDDGRTFSKPLTQEERKRSFSINPNIANARLERETSKQLKDHIGVSSSDEEEVNTN